MGPFTTLESRPRMALPDTPPELASPTTTSLSSRSSPSSDHIWASQTLAALPMSGYDKTPGRDHGVDDHQEDTTLMPGDPQCQQLPPFSALFGPSSSLRLPSALPPPHPMHSPLSRPHLLTAPTQSASLHLPSLAADPRAAVAHDALSHVTGQSYFGSRAPRAGESKIDQQHHWPQLDAGRQQVEYVLQEPGVSRRHFLESRDDATEHKNEAAGGSGGSGTESSVDKDGLDSEIRAGSYKMPRFVRKAEVPGEGMCYFYDDGTYCKTVIDGEKVNPDWGVTKARKPRKRLAEACTQCRVKKIKCEPEFPRCAQCEKFGRVCKFKTAPRGGRTTSPSTPPAGLVRRNASSSPRTASRSSSSPVVQPAAQSFDDGGSERQKVDAGSYSPSKARELSLPDTMDHSKSPHVSHQRMPEAPRIPDDILLRAWQTDVYASDPHSVTAVSEVVTQFFLHTDSAMLLKFLPETVWKAQFADPSRKKQPADLMLLYSVLTLGMALSGGPKNIAFEYAQVADYAQKNLGFDCLQLVQSRIILAAYCLSIDRIHDARELLSSASAVSGNLQLTVELEKSVEANMTVYPCGMTRTGYKESRRRTLWSLFLLERFNGAFPREAAMVRAEDLCIRLPTDNDSFEAQIERDEPLFDPYNLAQPSRLNVLAALVEMTHLWSECHTILYGIACRPSAASDELAKVQTLGNQIERWFTSLPENLSFSMMNLQNSAYTGSAGSFLSLHLLHHHAMIKVNRHHHSAAALRGSQVQIRAVQNCFDQAQCILDLLQDVERLRRTQSSTLALLPRVAAAAVVDAVDVLNTRGVVWKLPAKIDRIREALAYVERLSRTWEDVAGFEAAIRRRWAELLFILEQGPRSAGPAHGYRILDTSSGTHWQILEPTNTEIPKEMDVVYTMPLEFGCF